MLFTTRSRASSGPSLDTLIAISYTKLDSLAHLLSGNKDESDLLRRGVLLQNALEWGIEAREKERKQRTEESIFGMTRRKNSGMSAGWRGEAFESGMDALFEQGDEDDEDDAIEIICKPTHVKPVRDTAEVMDPTQSSMTHLVEEGEEAWFEQTWSELQAVTSPESNPMAITITDQDAEIYPIEDDDSMFSPSPASSRGSSRSTTPSPPPLLMEIDLAPPPSPKLLPTRIQDKLDGPMEKGTLAPALECGLSVEQVLIRYDILDDDDELELDTIDARLVDQAMSLAPLTEIYTDESDGEVDSATEDVPDFETDLDSDDDERDDTERQSPSPWLITPTEDVLDDFGSGGSFEDLHQYGFEQARGGMFAIKEKKAQDRPQGERRMIEVVR